MLMSLITQLSYREAGLRTCWRVSVVPTRVKKGVEKVKKRKGRGVNGAPAGNDVSSLTRNKNGGGEGEKNTGERDSVERCTYHKENWQ